MSISQIAWREPRTHFAKVPVSESNGGVVSVRITSGRGPDMEWRTAATKKQP
jgi:hypothetical protein